MKETPPFIFLFKSVIFEGMLKSWPLQHFLMVCPSTICPASVSKGNFTHLFILTLSWRIWHATILVLQLQEKCQEAGHCKTNLSVMNLKWTSMKWNDGPEGKRDYVLGLFPKSSDPPGFYIEVLYKKPVLSVCLGSVPPWGLLWRPFGGEPFHSPTSAFPFSSHGVQAQRIGKAENTAFSKNYRVTNKGYLPDRGTAECRLLVWEGKVDSVILACNGTERKRLESLIKRDTVEVATASQSLKIIPLRTEASLIGEKCYSNPSPQWAMASLRGC